MRFARLRATLKAAGNVQKPPPRGGGLFGVRSLVGNVQSGARVRASTRARVNRKAAENGGKLLSVELSKARAQAH